LSNQERKRLTSADRKVARGHRCFASPSASRAWSLSVVS
jgi:hypothetical protein